MWLFLSLLFLTLAAVFFGTAIAAIRAASRTRLLEVLDESSEAAVDRFFAHRREYARAVLIGQHLTIMIAGGVGLYAFQQIDRLGLRIAFMAAAGVSWILIFAVGIPVGWARYAGEPFIAAILPLLEHLRTGLLAMLKIVGLADEVVRRLAGAPAEPTDQADQIELEIMDAVSQGEISGMMNPAEKEIIRSALALDETSVGEVMTPRTDIQGIEVNASFAEVREQVLADGHSRVPVYQESLDHVVGILYAKDLLNITNPAEFNLRKMMRPATYVPETKDLSSLLREFQQNRVHIAIVLDEYGGTAGLVTLEDIMEELIGDIADEHEDPPPAQILRIDSHTADVDARVRVEDLNEELGIDLSVDDAYDTVAGYVFSRLGRIPAAGDTATEGPVRIEVLEAGDRSIRRLRVHLPAEMSANE